MKGLSINRPWVWAILNADKDVENRAWTSKHRGWIALHASAKPMPATDDDFPGSILCPDLKSLDYSALESSKPLVRDYSAMGLGLIGPPAESALPALFRAT